MPRKLPKIITEEEFVLGIKKVSKPKIKLAFMLGFYQAMRVSEVVNLKPDNADIKTGYIHIIDSKFGKDRDIPIMKPVEFGLRHLPVGVGIRALQKQIKKYWPELHFHSLRHSGATFYLNEKGRNIRQIQQLLGHVKAETTSIYLHINPQQLKRGFEDIW